MDCCDYNSLYYAVNSMCQKINEIIKRVNEIDPGTSELDDIKQQIEQLETDVQSNSIALLEKYSAKNPPPYPVTSVNGKTGALVIDYQEIVKNNGVQVKLMTPEEYNGTAAQTWTAYYELGFRIVGVKSTTENKIEAFYLLKQDANDHTPIPVTVQGGGSEVDPNLIEQVQKNTEAISAINDEMPRKYSPTNVPPYPVTSVNGKSGDINIDSLRTSTNIFKATKEYKASVLNNMDNENVVSSLIFPTDMNTTPYYRSKKGEEALALLSNARIIIASQGLEMDLAPGIYYLFANASLNGLPPGNAKMVYGVNVDNNAYSIYDVFTTSHSLNYRADTAIRANGFDVGIENTSAKYYEATSIEAYSITSTLFLIGYAHIKIVIY